MSKHTFSFYVNKTQRRINNFQIYITVDGREIEAKKWDNYYLFPIIDSGKEFNITINQKHIEFTTGPYKSWCLNNGSDMILGKITKTHKLLTVAKYNGMTPQDKEWKEYSKRYFIINRAYTIDIERPKKVKELQFFILRPYSKGDGIYILTKKLIKKK